MCPHCGQPFGIGPNCQYCGYPAPAAGGRPPSRGLAYAVLGLVSALVTGLVIWRVSDPPTSAGAPVAGATSQLAPTPPTPATTDTTGTSGIDTSTPDSSTTDTSTTETTTTDTSTTDTTTTDTSTTDTSTTDRSTTDTSTTDTSETSSSDTSTTDNSPPDTSTSPPTPTRGNTAGVAPSDTLKVGLSYLPTTTDPATDTGGTSIVWTQLFDSLTTYRGTRTTPAGNLAAGWQSADSSKVWTFRIVAGRKFHDGVPVTAKAVCDNFAFWNSVRGSAQSDYYNWAYFFGGFAGQPNALFKSCTAGAGSIVLTLAKPIPALPDILSQSSFGIHSPASMAAKKPVGSGPYQWVSGSSRSVILRATGSASAKTKNLQFLEIGDPVARATAIRNGEVQLTYGVSPPPAGAAAGTAQSAPADLLASLNLYGGRGPLADDKVRAAVVAGIDRNALAGAAHLEPATSVLPALFGGPRPTLPATDPVAATAVLKGKGVVLTIGVRGFGSSGTEPALAKLISAQLVKVGVTVKTKSYNSVSSYYDDIQAGKLDLSVGQVQAYMGDRGDYLSVYAPTATFGWVLPKNTRAAVGNQITQALSLQENDARQAASSAVLTELLSQNAVLPLFSTGGTWLIADGVHGFQPALFKADRLDSVVVR